MRFTRLQFLFVLTCGLALNSGRLQAWQADNGNGTFTNPLFYDEFSDPDIIRVGDDFYLAGTTMHTMPGLPVLHSKDLVNWEFLGYALDKLDLGPEFRLENGKSVYGQGIWAPSFRYHDGTFYIFSNVNGRNTQLFTATNPAGPWQHTELKHSFHDLSVLFDDDGKVYVVWGYVDIHLAQLTARFEGHRARHRTCSFCKRRRHGRRLALLQNQRKIFHHQRVVGRPDAPGLRACGQTGRTVRALSGRPNDLNANDHDTNRRRQPCSNLSFSAIVLLFIHFGPPANPNKI